MKFRRILAVAFLTIIFGGFIYWALSWHELEYRGKTLRFWANQYGTNHWSGRNQELDKQAETAVRSIGTNAIPILLKMMATTESPIRIKLTKPVPKKWLGFLHIDGPAEYRHKIYELQSLGGYGLIALGGDARAAVPTLVGLLKNKDPNVRYHAVFTLRCLGPVASNALPQLIKCLDDSEFTVRDDAVIGLGTMATEQGTVVPILIELLQENRTNQIHGAIICNDAMHALWGFGAQSKPAVPIILDFLNDERSEIRRGATNTLLQIDPEAAARAGVKYPDSN
jgi:hypothetical protein